MIGTEKEYITRTKKAKEYNNKNTKEKIKNRKQFFKFSGLSKTALRSDYIRVKYSPLNDSNNYPYVYSLFA